MLALSRSLIVGSLLALASPSLAAEGDAPSATVQQEAPKKEVHIPVSLTLVPGVSTNGLTSSNVVNNFSLGLLATHAGRVEGAAFSSGVNWVEKRSRAAFFAAAANIAEQGFSGAQFAGAANFSSGDVTGWQSAGAFNLIRGSGLALQLAGAVNLATGKLTGMQTSGALNFTGESFKGLQASGGVNIAGAGFYGLQASGGVNYAGGRSTGLQTTGGVSIADSLRGAQISVINIGGDVQGAQIGVINVARKAHGLQLGVINVASEMYGAPIGLVSIAKNGQFHLQAFATDVTPMNAALKFGSKHVYSLVSVGHSPGSAQHRHSMYGLGIGGHIPLSDSLYLDIDGLASNVHRNLFEESRANLLSQLRVVAGYQFAPRFSVFGGLTGNVFIEWEKERRFNDLGSGFAASEWNRKGNVVRAWPGLIAGVQI